MPARSTRFSSLAISMLTVVAALLASAPASAEAYSARDVSGWALTPSEDGRGCFLTKQYDGIGKTTLLLGLDIDGANRLSVLNDNWSIKSRERLQLNFRLSNGGYTNQVAIGIASDGKRGFVTTFEPKFPDYFATSEALHISRGSVPVEQLSLTGSGDAVAELRRCVKAQRAAVGSKQAKTKAKATDADARIADARRSSLIPEDPFAPGSKRRVTP